MYPRSFPMALEKNGSMFKSCESSNYAIPLAWSIDEQILAAYRRTLNSIFEEHVLDWVEKDAHEFALWSNFVSFVT